MALAEQATLAVNLQLKDGVSRGLGTISGKFQALSTKTAGLQRGLKNIGTGLRQGLHSSALLAGAGVAALTYNLKLGIDSLVELERVTYQTNARIESTGGVAGISAGQVRDLATQYENLTGVDDKVIQSAENVMLTFTNVRTDAFEPALSSALDLSRAMDQDLQTSIVQIGKALNDPKEGLKALTRVGVTFTDKQKEEIAALQASGDLLGAQNIILGELKTEFGDAAKAIGPAEQAQLQFKDAVEETRMALAETLLPALTNVSQKLRGFLKSDQAKAGIKALGDAIAGIFSNQNLDAAGGAIRDLFGYLKDLPWATISSGIQLSADAAKKAVDIFRSLPPGVQGALITLLAANKLTGGLVATGLGELLKLAFHSLTTITAGNVTVVGTNVTGGGGVPGAAGGGGVVKTVLTAVGTGVVLETAVTVAPTLESEISALKDGQVTLGEMDAIFNSGPAGTALGSMLDIIGGPLGIPSIADAVHATTVNTEVANHAAAQHYQGYIDQMRTSSSHVGASIDQMRQSANKSGTDLEQKINTEIERTAAVKAAIEESKRSIRESIMQNTRTLARKKMSVTIRNSTNVRISARQVVSETDTYTRWGGVVVT